MRAENLGFGDNHYYSTAKVWKISDSAEQAATFVYILSQIISDIKDKNSWGIQIGQVHHLFLIENPLVLYCFGVKSLF